jgi:hypothetical protein
MYKSDDMQRGEASGLSAYYWKMNHASQQDMQEEINFL